VNRYGQDILSIEKCILASIPMVHIYVYDRHLRETRSEGSLRRDARIIEIAIAIGTIPRCVVPWWPHQAVSLIQDPSQQ